MSVATETALPPLLAATWCAKMFGYLARQRNRVDPGLVELPECDFVNVAPRRTLRVLRPAPRASRGPPTMTTTTTPPDERPESLHDNFYSRWARRPHPSGECRCSFRRSRDGGSGGAGPSSPEERLVSQELSRIRTSLCEAERTGKDVEEVERSLRLALGQPGQSGPDGGGDEAAAQPALPGRQVEPPDRLEPLEEDVRGRIVRELDRYVGELLDEILDDTIRAIARSERPFDRREPTVRRGRGPGFDVNFSFHAGAVERGPGEGEGGEGTDSEGYVNRGFVGSASDPDSLDFHLRRRGGLGAADDVVVLEAGDCTDSGINSVETIELQPEQELEENLERSLMEIIDAKLGGAAIGKSLEDLGMVIDVAEDAPEKAPAAPEPTSTATDAAAAPTQPSPPEPRSPADGPVDPTTTTPPPPPPSGAKRPPRLKRRSLEEAPDEVAGFDGLRLEFEGQPAAAEPGPPRTKRPVSSAPPRRPLGLGSRLGGAMRLLRLGLRLGPGPLHKTGKKGGPGARQPAAQPPRAATLELEVYRRRFPVPEPSHRRRQRRQQQQQQQQARPPRRPGPEDDAPEATLRAKNRKPTLVFLHGFGSSAEAFGHQLRYFADLGYPCVAPELLGHGLSSAPGRRADYRFARLLEDLETVLAIYAFRPGRKCVIVAHNYGCSFATALAQKYAGSVHQLVLISGGGPTPLAPPASEGLGRCCLRGCLAPLLVCGLQRALLYAPRGRQHPYCGDEQREDQWPSHMRHVLRGMSWPEGDYVFHRRLCTPSLLVHGLRDNRVSLVQECQMERTMTKAFLEAIPAAGHIPMTDCPEQLNHMIHCFIDLWKNKKW